MTVRVRLFAAARQLAGTDMLEIECSLPASIAQVRAAIASHSPALAPLLAHCRFAVSSEYVSDDHQIAANEEIACIPPVSGG